MDLLHWAAQFSFVSDIFLIAIIDQHYALIIIPLFITHTPTCFDTYVPSSGIVLYRCVETCRSLSNKQRNNNQCIVLVYYTQLSNVRYEH
jgi:hypothetical protein